MNYFYKDSLHTNYDISTKTICVNDGMFIFDYDGPKAQIVWSDSKVSFYCEPREAFYEFFNQNTKKRIKYFFVQDFSDVPWGSYYSRWILAKSAFFVIDSTKNGAMGISYVPFKNYNSAVAFHSLYGGTILHFSEIFLKHLIKSNELLKQHLLIDF